MVADFQMWTKFQHECIVLANHDCSDGIDGLVKRLGIYIDLEGHYT